MGMSICLRLSQALRTVDLALDKSSRTQQLHVLLKKGTKTIQARRVKFGQAEGAHPFLTMPVKALKDWPMLESEGDMKSPASRVRPGPLASSCTTFIMIDCRLELHGDVWQRRDLASSFTMTPRHVLDSHRCNCELYSFRGSESHAVNMCSLAACTSELSAPHVKATKGYNPCLGSN